MDTQMTLQGRAASKALIHEQMSQQDIGESNQPIQVVQNSENNEEGESEYSYYSEYVLEEDEEEPEIPNDSRK